MSIKDVEFLVKDEKNHEIADQLVEYLQDLIRIASPSGEEEGIADFLMKFGEKRPLWNVERDEIDNIYFVPKGCEDQELAIFLNYPYRISMNTFKITTMDFFLLLKY